MAILSSCISRCGMAISAALLMAGCASYGGSSLKPNESTLADVVATMGRPAMSWKEPDGSEQLAYPRGPYGTQTFMVFTNREGRLARIEKVLDMDHFARIESGKSNRDDVLKLLGPVPTQNVAYFKARDELVWSWLFCDGLNQQAYFDVLFDATTGVVRSTQQRPDYSGFDGIVPTCGH